MTMSWYYDVTHCLRVKPPLGFPGGSDGKASACNAGDLGWIPELGRSPGEGNEWQPTPVFLPGESHGQEPGGLQSMGSLRGRYDGQTNKQPCGDWSLAPESRCGYWLAGLPALPLRCMWEPARDLPVIAALLKVISKSCLPCIIFS